MSRFLLVFSLLLSFSTQANDSDRLEHLLESLSNNSYTHPDEVDVPPLSKDSDKLKNKTIDLSDSEIEEKFGSSFHAIAKRYVNSNSLKVRDKPNGKVIDHLKRGDSVLIYDVAGKWERISEEGEFHKWVDSSLLCTTANCFKSSNNTYIQRVVKKSVNTNTYVTPRKQITTIGGCSCGSGNYCYGPRGGRYCYTSGGNKSYR
ncbi:hypothetical protein [Acinetobacter beijerinckii]|uniref:hypothetical protein n=1 Tax=Acinetobacter beijerinckii TaxID=262668 RepID=UPI003015D06A